MMRTAVAIAIILSVATSTLGAEWYETLHPGVTRDAIRKVAGAPTTQSQDTDRYTQKQGYIELTYANGSLHDCTHYDPGEGAVSASYYYAWGGELRAEHVAARRKYLSARQFRVLPRFDGPRVRATGHEGVCYQVDNQFIVIEPIISMMGGLGFFADKAAKVSLLDTNGEETVLYRAIDNWASLRPAKLSASEVQARTDRLRSLGLKALGQPVTLSLGHDDSQMGSGVDYRLYYIIGGLVVATVNEAKISDGDGTLESLFVLQPGKQAIAFTNWLAEAHQSAPPVSGIRGTPAAYAPVVPGIPER